MSRLHQDEVIAALREAGARRAAAEVARADALRDIAELLAVARAQCGGTFSAVIQVSGVSRRTAYRLLAEAGVEPSKD